MHIHHPNFSIDFVRHLGQFQHLSKIIVPVWNSLKQTVHSFESHLMVLLMPLQFV